LKIRVSVIIGNNGPQRPVSSARQLGIHGHPVNIFPVIKIES